MQHYLIVGNGVAGTTAAEQIRKHDAGGRITILSAEDTPFYYRIRLNEFVTGELDEDRLLAKKAGWYAEQDIDLQLRTAVKGGDAEAGWVVAEDDRRWTYDELLIATGSHAFIPPIVGADVPGVFSLRSLQDARNIKHYAEGVEEVVLIGGGLLGLEAGNALRKLGRSITVVEFFPRLLPRQLDVEGARRLQRIMEHMGFVFRLGAKTQAILGESRVEGVQLEGGETLPAQMVIVSAGVRPNLGLARALGVDTDKGIKVDDHLRTSRSNIYAAGDVAECQGVLYGIWPAAMQQGRIAGSNMAGMETLYHGTTPANTLKVAGVDLAVAGDIDAENQRQALKKTGEGVYKKIVLDQNRIVGCIMLGDTRGFNQVTRWMASKESVAKLEAEIDRFLA